MTAPLTEADVRRIVREEIATESRRGMARLRASAGLSLDGDDALLKGHERLDNQHLGGAHVQIEAPEVVVELQQAEPIDQFADRHELIGDLGQLRQTHESSPLVGEFSAPTVGERPVAGVEEASATAPAEGGDR